VIAPPDSDDLERVTAWFRHLSEHVQAVDFAGARSLFAEDMVAFGTFENFITGREAVERAQWRNVWPVTSDFRYRMDDIRALVSPDRLFAIGLGVFDSTGYHEDGTPYERPGRTTVALSRRRIGEEWVADHTHISLFRDVPSRSFGSKPGGKKPRRTRGVRVAFAAGVARTAPRRGRASPLLLRTFRKAR
jgi:ketosteroid isomerase-like protein